MGDLEYRPRYFRSFCFFSGILIPDLLAPDVFSLNLAHSDSFMPEKLCEEIESRVKEGSLLRITFSKTKKNEN